MNETIMVSHSLDNNTHKGHVISLCLNANPLSSLIPQMASNFRLLLNGDEAFSKGPTRPNMAQTSTYKTSIIFYSITKGIFKIYQIERVMAL